MSERNEPRDLPKAGWAHIHLDDHADPHVGLEEHKALCAASGYRCLVVSNRFSPALLADTDVTFEFAPLDILPASGTGQDPNGMSRYLFDRLSLTFSFWNVVGCTWSGNRADDVLSQAGSYAPNLAVMSRRISPMGSPEARKMLEEPDRG